jgi:hypothetical protein
MEPRLKAMRRLATLYAAVEEMHASELQRVTAEVREAEDAIERERQVARLSRVDGRAALVEGNRTNWMMAESEQETAAWRRRALELIRLKREELNNAAMEQYVASRLKREQMKRVCEDIASRLEIEEGRRVQAGSDDRFLARRRWTDARGKMRNEQEMKAS